MNVNPAAMEVNDPRLGLMSSELRERILDAATEVLLEEGLDARLHARIAERAGLSRPTVYKHVGDQAAILDAVLDREVSAFFTAAVPVLGTSDDLGHDLVDAVVFVVRYARSHALLQKSLREHPELILPALTTEAGALLDRVHAVFADQLGRALVLAGSDLDVRNAEEWIFRVIVSLITTPTGPPTARDEDLRAYIAGLVKLSGLVSATSVRQRAR